MVPVKKYDHLFKLMLIGDSGVGKTCLLIRYIDETFSPSFISTIGIDFKIKTIDYEGKRIKLQIWDTAGQERFRTITKSYYRGAMGILLVYDITNKNSFLNIRRWMHYIQAECTEVEKLVVANKCDKSDQRVVFLEEGEALCEEYQVPHVETSAKTGLNVDAAFEQLTSSILRKTPRNPEPPPITLRENTTSVDVSGCRLCS